MYNVKFRELFFHRWTTIAKKAKFLDRINFQSYDSALWGSEVSKILVQDCNVS